jgi:hypothetical protein
VIEGKERQHTSGDASSIGSRSADGSVVNELRTLAVASENDLGGRTSGCCLLWHQYLLTCNEAVSELTVLIKLVIVVLPAASPPCKNPETLAE